jgi:hypothetical protein
MTNEIISVSGLSHGGESPWFVVIYDDGDEEHRPGTQQEAMQVASDAGLQRVDTPARTFKWVRDPEAWHRPRRAEP